MTPSAEELIRRIHEYIKLLDLDANTVSEMESLSLAEQYTEIKLIHHFRERLRETKLAGDASLKEIFEAVFDKSKYDA